MKTAIFENKDKILKDKNFATRKCSIVCIDTEISFKEQNQQKNNVHENSIKERMDG